MLDRNEPDLAQLKQENSQLKEQLKLAKLIQESLNLEQPAAQEPEVKSDNNFTKPMIDQETRAALQQSIALAKSIAELEFKQKSYIAVKACLTHVINKRAVAVKANVEDIENNRKVQTIAQHTQHQDQLKKEIISLVANFRTNDILQNNTEQKNPCLPAIELTTQLDNDIRKTRDELDALKREYQEKITRTLPSLGKQIRHWGDINGKINETAAKLAELRQARETTLSVDHDQVRARTQATHKKFGGTLFPSQPFIRIDAAETSDIYSLEGQPSSCQHPKAK